MFLAVNQIRLPPTSEASVHPSNMLVPGCSHPHEGWDGKSKQEECFGKNRKVTSVTKAAFYPVFT
jgi:hypothetical protein